MTKVNTGTRTAKADAAAKAALIAEEQAAGAKIVTEGEATYSVTALRGMTIKTRVS